MIKTEFPWQTLPANLIAYGNEHSEKDSEFEQQVGFLLLDVGVETTLKTVYNLPEKYNQVRGIEKKLLKQDAKFKLEITDVVNLDKTSFHFLIDVARELCEEGVMEENDWKKLEYFHSIRNKLYHHGDGITTWKSNLADYAPLSRKLLKAILNVDLEPDAWADAARLPNKDGSHLGPLGAFYSFGRMEKDLSDSLEKLATEMSVITEHFIPLYTSRRIIRELNHIWEDMMKDEDRADAEYIGPMREARRKAFYRLMGQDLSLDNREIDIIIETPSYMWFAIGLSKLYKNYDPELNRYHDVRAFINEVETGRIWLTKKEDGRKIRTNTDDLEEIDREFEALRTWIMKVDKKARAFIEKMDKEQSDELPPA
jgi:hypothetical protein